jgi:hypothetical protein
VTQTETEAYAETDRGIDKEIENNQCKADHWRMGWKKPNLLHGAVVRNKGLVDGIFVDIESDNKERKAHPGLAAEGATRGA